MKILLLTSSLGAGGAERVASVLCSAWADRGDEVTLMPTYSGGGTPFYKISSKVEVLYLADLVGLNGKGFLLYFKRLFALRNYIRRSRPDVIVSFLPNVNVMVVLANFFIKIPLVICERTDPAVFKYSVVLSFACKILYRFSDMLVVQTKSVASKIPRLYPSVSKVKVVSNPLPAELKEVRRESDGGRKVLIAVGRLSSEKQFDLLVDCFSSVADSYEEWDLHIYGEGSMLPLLKNKVKQFGLEDRVYFFGNSSTLWHAMAGSDAFAMVSKMEGFPNVLLEAMGIGLPCVVFDCPSGPREITQDGSAAILVPLNDLDEFKRGLTKLFSDDVLRQKLGSRARLSVVERYDLPVVLQCWDAVFAEVGVND